MKIRAILTMTEMILAGTLFADTNVFKFDGDPGFEAPIKNKWMPNGKASEKMCSIVSNGRNGKSLQINALTAPAEIYSCAPILIEPEADRLKFSIFARGSGKFDVMLFCYGTHFLNSVDLLHGSLAEGEGWKCFQAEYKFDKAKYPKFNEVKNVRIAIRVQKGGNFLFDDLSCERISEE